MCAFMYCSIPDGSGYCSTAVPWEGTTCGNQKVCELSPTQFLPRVRLYTWYESGENICVRSVATERVRDFKS